MNKYEETGDVMRLKGLLTRKGWWIYAIALAVAQAIVEATIIAQMTHVIDAIAGLMAIIALTYIQIAINKARLNDAGWSGWWMLLPILNIVVMGFFPSKAKESE